MDLTQAGLLQLLGIKRGEDRDLVLEPEAVHTNAFGTVHLAVLTALAEGAAWLATGGETSGDMVMPIALTANFVRPTSLAKGTLTAKPIVENRGGTFGVTGARVYQDGKVVALFTVTMFIQKPDAK
jgi:uncharacterized protein (TIGR00369 family)